MGTLQAMTINAVMQVKSERQAQATFLIQEDIEKLQAAGSAMNVNYIQNSPILNPTGKTRTGICNPFVFNDNQKMDRRLGSYLVKEMDSLLANDTYSDGVTKDPTTKSEPAITFNTVFSSAADFQQFKTDADGNVLFTNNQPILYPAEYKNDDNVSVTKKVVVQVVRNGSDDDTDPNAENNLLNKNYRLVRMMTVDGNHDFNILQVYYRVGEPYDPDAPLTTRGQDQDGDTLRDDEPGRKSIIAENYTEVIPAAAAECGFSYE